MFSIHSTITGKELSTDNIIFDESYTLEKFISVNYYILFHNDYSYYDYCKVKGIVETHDKPHKYQCNYIETLQLKVSFKHHILIFNDDFVPNSKFYKIDTYKLNDNCWNPYVMLRAVNNPMNKGLFKKEYETNENESDIKQHNCNAQIVNLFKLAKHNKLNDNQIKEMNTLLQKCNIIYLFNEWTKT